MPLNYLQYAVIPHFEKGGLGGIQNAPNMKIPLDPPFPKWEVARWRASCELFRGIS
jgi:hypothetical protein